MSGEVRKGERIPRRDPPEFEEVNSFAEAISRDGFIGTALDDKNQYGPVAMMVLLLIVAAKLFKTSSDGDTRRCCVTMCNVDSRGNTT